MNLELISPLILTTALTFLLVACGDGTQPRPDSDVPAEGNTQSIVATTLTEVESSAIPTPRQVGNKIGDVAPGFNILLTNGETVSHSDFRHDSKPVFLFFFSTL